MKNRILEIVINTLTLNELKLTYKSKAWEKGDISIDDINLYKSKWIAQFNGILNGFNKRLLWEGFSESELETFFTVNPIHLNIIPEWAIVIEALAEKMENKNEFLNNKTYEDDFNSENPFQLLYNIISDVAYSSYLQDIANNFIKSNAIGSIKSDLVNRLKLIMQATLNKIISEKFSEFDKKLILKEYLSTKNKNSVIFDWLNNEGFLFLLQDFPMLARLIGETIINWHQDYKLFFKRFCNDQQEIINLFKIEPKSIMINDIASGLSDSHSGGKTVKHIYFSSGHSMIYKPKNIEIDKCYYSFSSWVNSKLNRQSLMPLKTICREDYGWVEYLAYMPINNSSKLPEFYYNAGVFLCVAHILKITDCHYENLIANSVQITLIDCETVMHPQVQQSDEFITNKFLNKSFLQSIFRTGFLPNWTTHLNNSTNMDISGLGGLRYDDKNVEILKEDRNSQYGSIKNIETKNQPLINPKANLNDFIPDLILGFTDCYNAFLECKNDLLNEKLTIIKQFKNLQTRFIYRATEVYDKVIRYAMLPENLKSGIAFSISLDILSRSHLIENAKTDLWKLYIHENIYTSKLDIPLFHTKTTSTEMLFGDESISFFEKSGYDLSIETIKNLSKDDLIYQLNILKGTIQSSNIYPQHSIEAKDNKEYLHDLYLSEVSKLDAINSAIYIGETILERKIPGTDYNWLAMSLNSKSGRYQFGTLGFNLYDGLSGIALFYSALFKTTTNYKYIDIVMNILKPITLAYKSKNRTEVQLISKYLGIGICEGVGSIIYSLALISEYTQEQELLNLSKDISHSLLDDFIMADEQFDVVSGCAGLILALIKLHNLSYDQITKDKLKVCGDFLCKALHKQLSSNSNKMLTGFSHGAAGYSYTLFKLFEVIDDQKYISIAYKCISYERNLFDKISFTYPDYRIENRANIFPNAWCHGVAGVILSRVASLKYLNSFDTEFNEIKTGIQHIKNADYLLGDHLCCGNIGRTDIMLSIGLMLNDKDLILEAKNRVNHLMRRANSNAGYKMGNNIPENFSNIGFFQGLSGIGYQILRTNSPDDFKSVLLFE